MSSSYTKPPSYDHCEIVRIGDEAGKLALRQVCLPIAMDSDLSQLAGDMRRILSESGGVGIAAPQIGIGLRAILIQRLDKRSKTFDFMVNPRIVAASSDTASDYEGCLSLPDGIVKVARSKIINVSYFNEAWREIHETLTGFTASIFQHELEHLDGILLTDKPVDGAPISVEEYAIHRRKRAEATEI